jgi:single-strand DNA-binding protein
MTQLTGRLTKDAVVNTTPDGRQVVNFSIAINDTYKPKGGEAVKTTVYVNCAYWISAKMATYLKKAALVEIIGRIGVSAYSDTSGAARASLNCHVNFIKLHTVPKEGNAAVSKAPAPVTDLPEEPLDDLPF